MATPFKRICRQAVHSSPSSAVQKCFAERQSTQTYWRPHISKRMYSLSSTSYASRSNPPPEDQDLSPQLSEEDLIEDLPDPSDLPSTAHGELQQHRELREMVRLAAWEMPLLSSLAKPFEPPNPQALPLRWRYTTYFGDSHPHSRKVVVCFNVDDLPELSPAQRETLKKLCGTRYNPGDNTVRMSSETFETQAQNKRFLGDTIQALLKEVTDPNADTFEDIPLDTRHYKPRQKLRFPEEWKLDAGKRAALEEKRRRVLLEEGKRVEENAVVSGAAAIEAARQVLLRQVEEPVMAEARQPLPKGKMGRKEMGQMRGAQR